MPRASRWSSLLAAAAEPRLRIALGAFGLGVVFGCGFLPRFYLLDAMASVVANFQARRGEDLAVHRYVDQAKLDALTYEQVLAEPASSVGKTVVWCVDHSYGSESSFADGRPSRPLLWTDRGSVPRNSPTSGGRCTRVAARVEGVKPGGVLLAFLGLP